MAFAFSALLYPHAHGPSLRSACPSRAGLRAYPVPLERHEWIRPCLSAGDLRVSVFRTASGISGHVPFGPGLTAASACLQLRRLSAIHLGWSYHPAWHLIRLAAGRIMRIPREMRIRHGGMVALSESLGTSPLPGTHRLLGYRRLNDGSPAGTETPPETILREAFASQVLFRSMP